MIEKLKRRQFKTQHQEKIFTVSFIYIICKIPVKRHGVKLDNLLYEYGLGIAKRNLILRTNFQFLICLN